MVKQPVSKWGARQVRQLKDDGYVCEEIARIIGYSAETVRKLLRYYREHGVDREPQQGKGKRSDSRYVFAGIDGEQRLRELDMVKEREDDSLQLKEVWQIFKREGYGAPAYRTFCHALQKHLDYTRKRVRCLPCAHSCNDGDLTLQACVFSTCNSLVLLHVSVTWLPASDGVCG